MHSILNHFQGLKPSVSQELCVSQLGRNPRISTPFVGARTKTPQPVRGDECSAAAVWAGQGQGLTVGGSGTIGPSSVPGSRSQNAHACCGSAWTIGIGSRSHTGSFPDQRPCQCAQVQHPPLVVSGRGVLWRGFMVKGCIKIQYIAPASGIISRILGPESLSADPTDRAPRNPAWPLPARSASPRMPLRAGSPPCVFLCRPGGST